jgi:outer membrane lipoprotein SlyB
MFKKLLILPAAALAFACSKGDKQTAADSALNSDLSTAAASRPYTPLDRITAPAPVIVKHTKRDAAIGAGAGAVIGAVTSKNKVKGAIIGGAAGAILGGIIGNNVDKTKK